MFVQQFIKQFNYTPRVGIGVFVFAPTCRASNKNNPVNIQAKHIRIHYDMLQTLSDIKVTFSNQF